ncbi:MAG: hypothetical protein ABFS12_13945 [Bacteroidota bacterium]
MKNTSINLVTIIFIILLSIPFKLVSQEPKNFQNGQLRIGFGVGLGQANIFSGGDGLSTVTLPTDFTNIRVVFRKGNFRLEPHLGYFRFSSSSSNSESSFSNLRLGSILSFAYSKGSMNYYYGINIGAVFTSVSDESKTDIYFGPVLGGEYMFSENFSLGGEIFANYILMGMYSGNNSNKSQSSMSTKGMVVLRWYVL